MTFDSSEEVYNIQAVYPEAELVLRIAVNETEARCPMGKKFGAPREFWSEILQTCFDTKMKVRGVSFHVGSGGCSYDAYERTLKGAEQVFSMAKQIGLPAFDILDIGGGFSESLTNHSNPDYYFPKVAPRIQTYLDNVFPGKNSNVQVIGEPGRYISQESMSYAVNVFLKKKQMEYVHYYINSGVYQGFGGQVFDGDKYKPQLLIADNDELKKRM
jgi:ornithine decarboxylase